MSLTVAELIKIMEQLAPSSFAEEWDNIGLQLGDLTQPVHRILVSLDVEERVIDEAISQEADIIISHHPLLFHPTKSLLYHQPLGKQVRKLIKNDISVFSAHTNLDIVPGGINDFLAELLDLADIEVLAETKEEDKLYGLGRVGSLPKPIRLAQLVQKVKEVIGVDGLRVVGDENQVISRVAVCGGGGMSLLNATKSKGADCFVTGDLKYHEGQDALAQRIAVIDAGHYATEAIFIPRLAFILKEKLASDVAVLTSQINTNPWRIY